jgi:hypothetical protein
VVDREEEEKVKKKMISLWKKQGKAGVGDWERESYGQDAEPSGTSAPTHYSITASTCTRLRIGLRFKPKYAGRRRGGAMMSGPLVNDSSQTAVPFQFPYIVLLHGQGTIFNLQPSSPSSI